MDRYVPADTTEICISPTERPGYFSFRLDAYAVLPVGWVVASALTRHPRQASEALVVACNRSTTRARELIRAALRSCPLRSYDRWRSCRLRAIEPDGLERPRSDWQNGQHIRVIVHVPDDASDMAVRSTLTSLRQQMYRNWSLAVVSGSERWMTTVNSMLAGVGRGAVHVRPDAPADTLWAELAGDVLLAPLAAGGTIPPYGLSALAEYSISHSHHEIIYADEDEVDHRGKFHDPLLKPDWSPIFQQSAPYVGRAIYLRSTVLALHKGALSSEIASDGPLLQLILSSAAQVGHLRRVLLTSTGLKNSEPVRPDLPVTACLSESAQRPLATIIIPSKDRADLLEACLKSLVDTQPRDFEMVIVDNGSEKAETLSLYDRLKADARVRILYLPGPFNFSALCNSAAAIAKASVIVFLNNDSVVRTPDWLGKLVSWALRPDVGAVGTRLVYPSGSLQHAGVVVGLGGHAAHGDRDAGPSQPGYMRRLVASREVSAVTAACLALEKAKFDFVGGFDESRFPIELNDIDLCLRLAAAGWTTVCLAEPILVHHESATRGTAPDLDVAYGHERRHFRDRWFSYIRDDPYFHPALSLHSIATALDQ